MDDSPVPVPVECRLWGTDGGGVLHVGPTPVGGRPPLATAVGSPAPGKPAKVKRVVLHAVEPLVAVLDVAGVVNLWNWSTRRHQLRFDPQAWLDCQHQAATAKLEAEDLLPTESSVSPPRRASRRSSVFGSKTAPARLFKAGGVKSVAFCDVSSLGWLCGRGGAGGASWLGIVCEHRVMLYDLVTTRVVSVTSDQLGKQEPATVARVGPSTVVVGCTDGALLSWHVGSQAPCAPIDGNALTSAVVHLEAFVVTEDATVAAAAGAGNAASSASRLVAVSVDGMVTSWRVGGGGTSFACATTLPLDVDVQCARLCAATGMLAVLASSGKVAFLCDVGATASTRVRMSKVCAGDGAKLTGLSPVGPSSRFPPDAVLTHTKAGTVEVLAPPWQAVDVGAGGKRPPVPAADPASCKPVVGLATCRAGVPPGTKTYTLAGHPVRNDIVAVGTSAGVFVVSVAPLFTAATSTVSSVGDGGERRVLHLRRDGNVVATTVAEEGLSPGPDVGSTEALHAAVLTPTWSPVLRATPPMVVPPSRPGGKGKAPPKPILPSPEGGVLSLSRTRRFVGVVWPHLKSFCVYDTAADSPQSPIVAGTGVDLVWAGLELPPGGGEDAVVEAFAVMEPPVVMKARVIKGPSGPESVTPPPIPACITVRSVAQSGAVAKVEVTVPAPRPPAALFGGPLLGVALSSDAAAIGGGGAAGTGGESLHTQFFDWVPAPAKAGAGSSSKSVGVLTAVGTPLPTPTVLAWQAGDFARLVLACPHTAQVFALAPSGRRGAQLVPLCTLAVSNPTTALWSGNTLFLADDAGVSAVFTAPPGGQPAFPDATGVAACVQVPVLKAGGGGGSPRVHPAPVACVGNVALLGVMQHRLLVGVASGDGSLTPIGVSLRHPVVSMGMCVAAGRADDAVQWGAALPPEAQGEAALLLGGLGCCRPALRLPHLPPAVGVPMALFCGAVPYLRHVVDTGGLPLLAAVDADVCGSVQAPPRAHPSWLPAAPDAVGGGAPPLHLTAVRAVATALAGGGDDALLLRLAEACTDARRPHDAAFIAALVGGGAARAVAGAAWAAEGMAVGGGDARERTSVLVAHGLR